MDQINFVGCVLSLDCGDSLGTFQGEVTDVNKAQQSISLRNPYRNGVKFDIKEVTIRAIDIRDLKILKSIDQETEAQQGKGRVVKQNGTSCVQPGTPNGKHRPASNGTQATPKKNERQTGSGNRRTPTKPQGDQSSQNGSESGRTAIYSGTQHSAFQRVQKDEAREQDVTPDGREAEDKGRKSKHFTGNIENNQRVRSSPRKIEGGQKQKRVSGANAKNEECFSAPVESFLTTDFDFDKSRESFNKAAVFEEITSIRGSRDWKKKVKNIPHNEDILLDNVPAFIHDKGGGQVKCTSYMAETGVPVPAVSVDTMQRVFQEADKLGLTVEKRLEAAGVCITGLVQDLIDGTVRDKEQARVMVVCGPHLQGAQGINLARHLANRNLNVTLFIPNFAKLPDILVSELKAFKMSNGQHVTNVKDLPEESPDIIISALDTPSDGLMAKQPWYKTILAWVSDCKSSVLAVDPVPTHGIRSKWSVITGLPLSYDNTNPGILYLCDVGIPVKMFSLAGVQYTSPYKKKFVVRLHNH